MSTATSPRSAWSASRLASLSGSAAVACLLACVTSGLVLVRSYDPANARASIASWLLEEPGLAYVRSVHAWAAWLCLGGALVHVSLRFPQPAIRRVWAFRAWLLAGVAFAMVAVATGWLLRGDPAAQQARATLRDMLSGLGGAGGLATAVLLGNGPGLEVVLFQHAALVTLGLVLLVAADVRRLEAKGGWTMVFTALALGGAALVSPGLSSQPQFGPREDVVNGGRIEERVSGMLPLVGGRPEGCLQCHGAMAGLGEHHRPAVVGCASCHRGDAFARDAAKAHVGLIRIPGNLADASRTCGQAGCHDAIVPRVERSIMTTMSGVIAVDRAVFGEEIQRGASAPHVARLGTSPADSHVRQLCASCHLGQAKETWGPNTESSRGGGCNACHLAYDEPAKRELQAYERAAGRPRNAPMQHPALKTASDDGNCFGCHSRSSRISTNYEGWHERREPPPVGASGPEYRQLEDGRWFGRQLADVHRERGLGCVDCHTAAELMGRGMAVTRKHEQVQIRCEDCHTRQFATVTTHEADPETQLLLQLDRIAVPKDSALATTARGEPLVNVVVRGDGRGELIRKRSGEIMALKPPSPSCAAGVGHRRLSCASCHSAWAPRCASCHTSFDSRATGYDLLANRDVKGAWQEQPGAFEAVPPTLGIRMDPVDATHPNGVVDPFIPGMILELDRNRTLGGPPDVVFRRLYARTAPHTTRRDVRSCESCHTDPVALGYGRGELRFERGPGAGEGRWRFKPEHGTLTDGLPADAWIGFLQTRNDLVSTRDDVRPFSVDEQRRILGAGACLTCHAGDSAVMRAALADMDATEARRSSRCAVPRWDVP